MADDKSLVPINIPLTGRLKTSIDGTQLTEGDFQLLSNMRYTDAGIRSISGMTKINTTALTSYPKIRSGIHFVKDQPSESHILVQAYNSAETQSRIYQNLTAVPGTGDFSATELHTDTSGAGLGRFSNAPDGCIIYCNGKESLVWGGAEYRTGAFFNFNPDNTWKIDYSDAVKNTLDDTINVATLKRVSAAIDSNTMLLLHLDSNFTDSSPTTPHTVTNNNVTFDTSIYKFGSASADFSGVGDNLTIPDNADFDLSDGTWTIDFWLYPTAGTLDSLYYQQTDANNFFTFYFQNQILTLRIMAAGSYVVDLSTGSDLTMNAWQHIELVENGDDYFIFINGTQKAYVSDTSRPVNYTGSIVIGQDMTGKLDEFRVSNNVRHTLNFLPPQQAYSTSPVTYTYLGTVMPIQGIKFYVKTANTVASGMNISYWNGSAWTTAGSLSDGTAVAGKSLAQTGIATFSSTETTAKPKIIYGVFAYWYLVSWSNLDETTQVSYITVDAPMQLIRDIWDGIPRTTYSYFLYKSGIYTDKTLEVTNNSYVDADPTTYVELDSLATSGSQFIGFTERCTGLRVNFVGNHVNTTANTILTVYYWNGQAWTSVGTIDDGTRGVSQSFNQSGFITWDGANITDEYKTTIGSNDTLFYYYKLTFSQALSADVQMFYIAGVPAQTDISPYKFSIMFQNRVVLCSDQSENRNEILIGGYNSVAIWNGGDSGTFYLGDNKDLIAAGSLYTRYGGTLYENLVITKKGETWLIDGTSPSNYVLYKISESYGCVAHGTFKVCDIGYEIAPGINKHVAIWQAEGAMVIFDSNVVLPIHYDIKDVFDPASSITINTSMIHKSEGFYDEAKGEYHWLWASGASTTLDKEYVYDLIHRKWFTIDRGTGKKLQLGIPVSDTNGKKYIYGAIDTGYLERLENGTTFDATSIVSEFRTPDIPIAGWGYENLIRKIGLLAKTKANTTNSVAVTHYGDMANGGTAVGNLSVTDTTKRVKHSIISVAVGPHTFHSLHCSMTTSNENIGFEPIGLQVFYKTVREHLK